MQTRDLKVLWIDPAPPDGTPALPALSAQGTYAVTRVRGTGEALRSLCDARPDAIVVADWDADLTLFKDVVMEVPVLWFAGAHKQARGFEEIAATHWRRAPAAQPPPTPQPPRTELGTFAVIAHELRSPLSAILILAEQLSAGVLEPSIATQRAFAGRIRGNAARLMRLLDRLLELARVDAGKLALRPERVVVAPLVREVISMLGQPQDTDAVKLRVELDPTVDVVHADPTRLQQVVQNLLSNAFRFSEQGTITLRVRALDDDRFCLEVEDQGIGITRAEQERLFQPFQQVHGERPSAQRGFGLGLALCRRIVEAHGGQLGVESEPGRGSRFYAILPRSCRLDAALASSAELRFLAQPSLQDRP